jgi:DNA polymerase I
VSEKQRLIIFDGNALMHRAFHAIPSNLTTPENEPINAVYGVISILVKIIIDLKPTHLAFAFDRPEPTFRKKLLETYQSQRPEMDNSLSSQFALIGEALGAMNIPVYDKAGFEADDVIGTIAKKTQKDLDEIIVVTGDRDMLQLVDKKVKLLMPQKSINEIALMDSQKTVEKLGVPPEKVVLYKALVGDASDNYKGVAGIGPKTAIGLTEKYDSFDDILQHIEEIPDRIKDKINADVESGKLSEELARIVCDVDVKFDLEKMGAWDVGSKKAIAKLQSFGFKTLTKRVQDLAASIESSKQQNLF